MMKNNLKRRKIDPEHEDFRICPFCGEAFMASHPHRLFCEEKYGKMDYCLNKMKTKRKHECGVAVLDRSQKITKKDNIKSENYESIQTRNLLIIKGLPFRTDDTAIVDDYKLEEQGFDFDHFHAEGALPHNPDYRYKQYGDFIMMWLEGHKLFLTNKFNLPWTI